METNNSIRLKIALLGSILLFAFNCSAQSDRKGKIQGQMQQLKDMIGIWEGEGYIIDRESNQKVFFRQREEIHYALDSTIVMVDGQGHDDDKLVHHAKAILAAGDTEQTFDFYSFLQDGRKGKYEMRIADNQLVWKIPLEQGEIRYTMHLNGDEWKETGEFNRNGTWYPFMEMKLKKQAE